MRNIGNLKLNIKELALLKSKPVEYIEEVLIKSYSHKPYLAQMPYDRNTRNPYKMCARWMALDEYEDDLMKQIEDLDEQCEKAIDNYINSKDQLDQLIHEDLPNARADINSDIGEYGIDVNWDGVEYASDVDEYLQSEKERVRENLVDTIFMDDKFPAHSDVYQDLVELDLSKFRTDKVIKMFKMFSYCTSLKKLDLSKFKTIKVKEMNNMFAGCSALEEINLTSFNTFNVEDMGSMFSSCSSLKKLDLSNFNTKSVKNMSNMFYQCSSLKELNVSNFNTENVINMSMMFGKCSSLKELNLSSFNTINVEDMRSMFYGASSLINLD